MRWRAGSGCGFIYRNIARAMLAILLSVNMYCARTAAADTMLADPVLADTSLTNTWLLDILHVPDSYVEQAELYTGYGATINGWFSHIGVAWAPFGAINTSGIRLRLLTGYGQYRYQGVVPANGTYYPAVFVGTTKLAEAMLGYSFASDPLYAKLYIGAAWEDHEITPEDPQNTVQGTKIDAKTQIELWLNLGKSAWLSTDASYALAFQSYNVMSKVGYHLFPSMSVGAELGALGNEKYDATRYGGFVRLHNWYGGDFTLSGGMSGDYDAPSVPYGTLSYATKF